MRAWPGATLACMKKLAIVVAGVGAFSSCVAAATGQAQQTFGITGAGTRPCSEWTEARAKAAAGDLTGKIEEQVALSWIQGFFNGMNIMQTRNRATPVEPPISAEIRTYIDRYCASNPRSAILDASVQLYLTVEKAGRR